MATYLEIFALKNGDNSIKTRLTVAIAKAAQDILFEDPGYSNHANRIKWAAKAMRDTGGEVERFMWPTVSNATIQSAGDACTDADIQYVVNSNIDLIAGA